MGKKKEKGGKDKLPKTIAGVKVPKELRKGGQFARFMNDPMVREIALAALAAGLAARKDARRAAKRTVAQVGEAAEDAAEGAGKGAGWIKAALGAAAIEAGRMVIDVIEDSGGRKRAPAAKAAGRAEAEPAGADSGGGERR